VVQPVCRWCPVSPQVLCSGHACSHLDVHAMDGCTAHTAHANVAPASLPCTHITKLSAYIRLLHQHRNRNEFQIHEYLFSAPHTSETTVHRSTVTKSHHPALTYCPALPLRHCTVLEKALRDLLPRHRSSTKPRWMCSQRGITSSVRTCTRAGSKPESCSRLLHK
jgi:hypothetical protein